ncbi:uncharacterized protein UHOD_04051 [Ustilago sp. UG-2017b]|nr:uncharacterized protein UHOD_04051 [Ustilago sp. UG-2017b]
MIAELLAMLAGHPSSLFASSSTAAGSSSGAFKVRDNLDFLHPSEIEILNHLATFYTRYTRIKTFAESQIEAARQRAIRSAIRANSLASSRTTNSKDAQKELEQKPTLHLVPLCSTLLSILAEYHALVLQTERLVLDKDVELVAGTGFVSLANLRARFKMWDAPLTALDDLVTLLQRGPNKGRDVAFAKDPSTDAAIQEGKAEAVTSFPADWTGGLLIDLLSLKASTGVERVAKHMSRLRNAVEDSWMQHLTAWVCRGEIHRPGGIADPHASKRTLICRDQLVHWIDSADTNSHTDNPAIAQGDGLADWVASSSGNTWAFRPDALPASVSESTADSILYVGRALYTIRYANVASAHLDNARTRHSSLSGPPSATMQSHESALASAAVRPSHPSNLDRAIQFLRNDVSEWIFRNILTTSVVHTSLQCLGDYFLHRNGPYVLLLLEEVETMRKNKLYCARSAAASMIRASDLELSLRRATVGTWAEDDPSLQRLRFALPKGGYRPSLVGARNAKVRGGAAASANPDTTTSIGTQSSTGAARFDDYLIGVPAQLHYTAVFPLDLFLSASDLAAYSRIFSYLIAIKKVQSRVLNCWIALSKNQRGRRKFTGTGEGGVDAKEEKQRARLLRCSWGVVRSMKWFLDTLLGHFQTDIIDAQFGGLTEQLRASLEPAQGGNAVLGRVGARMRKDSSQQQHRSSSPMDSATPSDAYGEEGRQRRVSGSTIAGTSRAPTVVGGAGGRAPHRRFAFPVSGPTPAPPASVTGGGHRAGRRFVSSSTRPPSSIVDGVETVRPDGNIADEAEKDTVLDFASLRASHTAFLAFVQDGLLLSSPVASSLVRSVLDICDRFVGVVERWGGDVLPPLLGETSTPDSAAETNKLVQDRQHIVDQTTTELDGELMRFFKLLSSSSSPASAAATGAGDESTTGIGSMSISVAQLHLSGGAKETGRMDVSGSLGSARRHLEQLLLRLDYSGFFAERVQRERAEARARLDETLAA